MDRFAVGVPRVRILQLLLKSPSLIRLIELRVKQHVAAVAQRKEANDEKDVSTCPKKRLGSSWERLSFSSELHARLLSTPVMLETPRVRSSRHGSGPTNVYDPARLPSLR